MAANMDFTRYIRYEGQICWAVKMENFNVTEQELLRSFIDALGDLPRAHVTMSDHQHAMGRYRADALIDVEIAGRQLHLLVEVKREAFPRDVRETLWQFRNYLAHANSPGTDIIPFIAARAISRGARDLLREEGVGYYDLGGSLFIPSEARYILIDRPPPKRSRRIVSILEGQKARTIITLFAHRNEWVGVKELAELAEVSPATASATLTEMERREWVDVDGTGPTKVRRLRDPTPLLDEWSRYAVEQKSPKIARYYVPSPDIHAICRQLDQACRANDLLYAVTGEAAAQHYAPYLSTVSQVRCRMPSGRQRDRALEQIDARPVSEGWNLGVLPTKASDVIVGDEDDGVAFAPILQVYIDLLQGSGRSKEMAAHLRTEKLLA